MIEFCQRIHRYGRNFHEVLCCDCFFDKVYFLLRKKEDDGEIFQEEFEKYDDCFIYFFDGTIIVICSQIIKFIRDEKNEQLFMKICTTEVVFCSSNKIVLCSICIFDIFKKLDILHRFKLKNNELFCLPVYS